MIDEERLARKTVSNVRELCIRRENCFGCPFLVSEHTRIVHCFFEETKTPDRWEDIEVSKKQ